MKNNIKKTWQGCIQMCFLLLLMIPVTTGVSASPLPLNYPPPTVTITGRGSNSVDFAWGAVSGATSYQIWYVDVENNTSSAVFNTGNTNIAFSALPKGTYDFYFRSVFDEKTSDYVIEDDLIML